MVEVVTSEEFSEFQRSIEEKLDSIQNNLDELMKSISESQDKTEADLARTATEINRRIDELEGSNRGFIARLRDAISTSTPPPTPEEGSNPVEKTEKTLGKVADVISRCPNFFDWDWCQVNCPLYQLCDNVSAVQDASKLSEKTSTEKFKDILKQFISNFEPRGEEQLKRV
jgi:hypothetical protein